MDSSIYTNTCILLCMYFAYIEMAETVLCDKVRCKPGTHCCNITHCCPDDDELTLSADATLSAGAIAGISVGVSVGGISIITFVIGVVYKICKYKAENLQPEVNFNFKQEQTDCETCKSKQKEETCNTCNTMQNKETRTHRQEEEICKICKTKQTEGTCKHNSFEMTAIEV